MKPLCLLLAVCVAGLVARADQRDNDRRDRRERGPRVIVYEDAGFRGSSLVLYRGDTLKNLDEQRFPDGGSLNDSISSIRVEAGAEIYVYVNARFDGQVMRLTTDARDLSREMLPESRSASWNDRISSLRVEESRRGSGVADADTIMRNAYRDVLGRDVELAGLGNLRSLILDQGWTEEMVRDNLRRSAEFRGEGANRVIRQAFLDVLGREPNGRELDNYRKYLFEKKWLGNEVREDLKRSDEYRRKPGGPPGKEDKPAGPRNRRN